MMEDYQPESCFKCGDDLIIDELTGNYVCEECGETYEQIEYQRLVDAESSARLEYFKQMNPKLFSDEVAE